MTGNPYYWMIGRQSAGELRLTWATLLNAETGLFQAEGMRTTAAGRASGLTLRAADEGKLFLCAGGEEGWFPICRMVEQ